MFKLLTFLSMLTFSTASVTQFTMRSCGTSTDLAQNIILNVEPVLPQSDYKLFLDADLSQTVNQGTSKYSVTYNFIPLSPTTEDLCTEIAKSNITCPLNNTIASESKGTVPTGLSGTVVIKNEWFDISNARILCMQFTIKIAGLNNTTNTTY
jgi:hypothetical protein